MDLPESLNFIETTEDMKALEAIRRAAKQRQEALLKEAARHRAAQAWDRVKCHKQGDVLYCCADGIFIGGHLQRGDKVKVYAVQPRKKLLWATLKGEKEPRYFTPGMIARYDLRQFPPEKPISLAERKLAEGCGKVMERLIG